MRIRRQHLPDASKPSSRLTRGGKTAERAGSGFARRAENFMNTFRFHARAGATKHAAVVQGIFAARARCSRERSLAEIRFCRIAVTGACSEAQGDFVRVEAVATEVIAGLFFGDTAREALFGVGGTAGELGGNQLDVAADQLRA